MGLRDVGRLLYVASVDLSRPTGPGVNEREFVIALCRAFGDRVHVIVPTPERPVHELAGNQLLFSRGFRSVGSITYLSHQVSQARLAHKLLSSISVDLMIFRLNVFPLAQSWIANRHASVPYVVKTLGEGVLGALKHKGGPIGRAAQPVSTLAVRRLARNALAVDACTPQLVTLIGATLNMHTDSLRVIENATNTARFRPVDVSTARRASSLEAFDPVVGLVGGEPWNYGGRQLVELAPDLVRRFPKVGIVIVGGGPRLDDLRARAADLGVAESCIITGRVPYERVPDYVNSFDVGIALDHTSRSERIGTSFQKIRQYVACGKPVLCQPGGNAFVEENAFGSIVPAEDHEWLRQEIVRWLSLSREEKADHSQRAAAFAQKHLSVERTLEERLDFWDERIVMSTP